MSVFEPRSRRCVGVLGGATVIFTPALIYLVMLPREESACNSGGGNGDLRHGAALSGAWVFRRP